MRKISVVTGTRAEFGLLKNLISLIHNDSSLELNLIVTGSHLCQQFGYTRREIEAAGFPIARDIDIVLASDTGVGVAKSAALASLGFADAWQHLTPDIVILLGDRYEVLAAAQTASLMRIPIAHIHGGELTLGAIDDKIRHAVTKLSTYHFVASQKYRNRVIQLGEQPESVWNVGAYGVENVQSAPRKSLQMVSDEIQFSIRKPFFLVTLHPETTLGEEHQHTICEELLNALEETQIEQLIFTKSNSDTGGFAINQRLELFCEKHSERATLQDSLGVVNFLSLLRAAKAIIGNSSSGILEAPYCRIPTINIGSRQEGRTKAASVIDSEGDKASILKAIELAGNETFQGKIQSSELPYGDGDACLKTFQILDKRNWTGPIIKRFYDMNGST